MLLASGLLSNHTVALVEDVPLIPDYYNEAGISDTRQDVSFYSNEFIDPFTGSLQGTALISAFLVMVVLILSFCAHITQH